MKLFNLVKFILPRTHSSRIALIASLVFGLAYGLPAYSEQQGNRHLELKPYSLNYTADLGGMKIKANHQLKLKNGRYSLTAKAKNFLGTINEFSSFKVSQHGDIIPIEYSKRQKTLMGSRSESQQFDWSDKTLLYASKDQSGKIDLSPGQFDRISLNQQLRVDVASGKEKFAYTVIRKGQLKQYKYRVLGRETVTTSNGSFNSLIVERLGNNTSKKAKIWLATDWDFIILKMETFEKDANKTLVFDQGQLNGNLILPLKNTTEI
jgi:hypothetical protein